MLTRELTRRACDLRRGLHELSAGRTFFWATRSSLHLRDVARGMSRASGASPLGPPCSDIQALFVILNGFACMPRVRLYNVWTRRQAPVFTSRVKRRNLAASNKVHPGKVGLAYPGSAQLPSRPLPKLRPAKPRDRLTCSSLTIFNSSEPLHPPHIRMTSSPCCPLHCTVHSLTTPNPFSHLQLKLQH